MGKKKILVILLLVCLSTILIAQNIDNYDYRPAPENLRSRKWFKNAKFGMFIHWGVYSVLGDGEWVMEHQEIKKDDYEKLTKFFNPTKFNAEKWVSLAKEAGMKYITITTKHHDGFCVFNSDLTNYDIVDSTPYGKDIIKELAEECHKQGIKLFFYYSQLDWHHNDYYPRGRTGKHTGRPEEGDWNNYIDYMNGQLEELLTNYGDVAGIWFDGYWDKKDANWRLKETYSLIHELQPDALIGSNHHEKPNPGEDIQMFEKGLPGQSPMQAEENAGLGNLPYETCETINKSWGFDLQDNNFKSKEKLVGYLVESAGYNSNLLLNVGPMPNGEIQKEFRRRLKKIGNWIDQYGETIYGTRGGPAKPQNWGVTTQKEDKFYIHLLDPKGKSILLPKIDKEINSIQTFDQNKKVSYTQTKHGIVIKIPEKAKEKIDAVLEVETK